MSSATAVVVVVVVTGNVDIAVDDVVVVVPGAAEDFGDLLDFGVLLLLGLFEPLTLKLLTVLL